MCVGSETNRAECSPRARIISATERSEASVLRRLVLAEDRVLRDVPVDRVLAGDGGFRGPVAGHLAAGHDERLRQPRVPQRDRMVEPGGEHRRRAPVVLGGTQDDDRVNRPLLVPIALLPDRGRT